METKLETFIRMKLLTRSKDQALKVLSEMEIEELKEIISEFSPADYEFKVVVEHYDEMRELLKDVKPEDFYNIEDEFWDISRTLSECINVEWCDPDTDYYDDIMARYRAVEFYLRENHEKAFEEWEKQND